MSERKRRTDLIPTDVWIPDNMPYMSKPKIIGYFSVNGDREYCEDASNCKYLSKVSFDETVNIDLNHGMENVIRKTNDRDEKIDFLLHYISKNLPELRNKKEDPQKILAVDFVCFRGLLRMLMCAPYEQLDNWIVLATKYKGTIYLCAQDTEECKKKRATQDEKTKRVLSYGFKFEQYMLTGRYLVV